MCQELCYRRLVTVVQLCRKVLWCEYKIEEPGGVVNTSMTLDGGVGSMVKSDTMGIFGGCETTDYVSGSQCVEL